MKKVTEKQAEKQAQEIFKNYGANKVYITSDGQAFAQQSHAKAHAHKENLKLFFFENKPEQEVEDEDKVAILTALKDEAIADLEKVQAENVKLSEVKLNLENQVKLKDEAIAKLNRRIAVLEKAKAKK